MSIYTKQGDAGITSLLNGEYISKADERIELIGTLDELSSYIGLAKVISNDTLKEELSFIQEDLMTIMAAIADSSYLKYNIDVERICAIEERIDELEKSYSRPNGFVLYGGCELSARLDVARAVARRAERIMVKIDMAYKVSENILKYMNRLSDYLYMIARYQDNRNGY